MIWKPKNPTYMLRTCEQNYTSYGGFKWPELVGFAETPIYVKPESWNPVPICGNGLHGYVEGKGFGDQLKLKGLWQIVEVEKSEIVIIDDKAKVPQCNLVFCGSRKDATDFLVKQRYPHPVFGATVAVGNNEIVHVGNYGTATTGFRGTATAEDYGTATAGDFGTATVGIRGTATVGYSGTATAGNGGKAKVGTDGTIQIQYFNKRFRLKTGYIGEDGLLPDIFYKLNTKFEFERTND